MGYVTQGGDLVTADYVNSGSYEIEIACERYPAKGSLRPLYDPKAERAKV